MTQKIAVNHDSNSLKFKNKKNLTKTTNLKDKRIADNPKITPELTKTNKQKKHGKF